jgi:hypothetical protein
MCGLKSAQISFRATAQFRVAPLKTAPLRDRFHRKSAAMSIVRELATIWFVGLGLAIMLRLSPQYVRATRAWLVWPFALVLRITKRWLQTLLKAFVRWIIHHTRHW